MKYLILFIFLPLFSFAQSNNEMLPGLWVKVKAKMKDGSRIVDHNGCGMDFIKYNFTNDGFVNSSNDVLFDGYKLQYKLSNDSLSIGGNLFNMIGLTKDTLKLSFFVLGAEDKQIPVFYFVKVHDHTSPSAATFNVALKDSVYQATNQLFPQCKGTLFTLMGAIQTNYDKGTLKASFIIDKKGRVKSYTILDMDSISKGFAKIVGNALGDISWIPALKNNVPVNSIVQLTFKSGRSKYAGQEMNSLNIEYSFLPKAPYPVIDKDEADAERQFFNNAINQVNNHNYEKAIELLNKCIEIDSIDLNAYNLRAMVNSSLGKSKEACKDWTILAGFGQVTAAKNLAKFCKN
jgi:hypothetical protein